MRSQAQIIDDLLDWSRIQTGKLTLEVKRVDLAAIVKGIADASEEDAGARGIALRTRLPDQAAIAFADPVRCEQIVWNLVSNALKFTPAGGHIELRLSHEGRMLRLDVEDNGQGIEGALLAYVFDMFRQGPRDRARGGLGIGLALVRQLVEKHGGRIIAASGGPGMGTTMSVWLPAADDQAPAGIVAGENRSIAGLRILLVEDDRETASSLTALLGLEGATVLTAQDATVALRLLAEQPVDAVVSDIALPGMDGYELMREVRANPRWRALRCVALTGHDREQDIQTAYGAGYDVHLAKPLDFSKLLDALGVLVPDQGREAAG